MYSIIFHRHIPKAKATAIADTPELKRIAKNTKIQSNVKYHADFEKNKGKLTQVRTLFFSSSSPFSPIRSSKSRATESCTLYDIVKMELQLHGDLNNLATHWLDSWMKFNLKRHRDWLSVWRQSCHIQKVGKCNYVKGRTYYIVYLYYYLKVADVASNFRTHTLRTTE